ncbi:hypothetical protein [Streptomyces morookaense]|uniref:Uncharacterized protein n=1 Tax=Streptomyces morookaense TaxID=1970 RepID=A0A7Y7E583_STRMO|nr:hypothetical protein [Streptomyces morookaense]NVK76066.1 hypothetical protein [Streptomyces morookaense]GHF37089.1 hypothetical protein GCM10010359_44660 [Streptomyces morookaense]
MRDAIARALLWVLRLLLPAHGRHDGRRCTPAMVPVSTAPAPVPTPPTQSPYVICGGHKPIPPHHLARYILPPDTRPLVPRYLVAWERELERRQQRERRRAIEAMWEGRDYPYSYPGALFTAMAVTA